VHRFLVAGHRADLDIGNVSGWDSDLWNLPNWKLTS
jgi:hypothetical protein